MCLSMLQRPDIIFYLHLNLETTMRMIKKRNRAEEKSIDPMYLDQLMQEHQLWYDPPGHLTPKIKQFHPEVAIHSVDMLHFIDQEEALTHFIASKINSTKF
jgi:deoxyadenosine/deoxycytidine kinase